MNNVYVVRTVPVRDTAGSVAGWVRVDLFAEGTGPTDVVFLRDGTACGQAEAAERVAQDRGLLYRSEDEAVRDGLARLRAAAERGVARPIRTRRRATR